MLILTYRYEVHVIKVVYIRQKKRTDADGIASAFFFAEASYENCNLPRHLPGQLQSAEANYEG